MQLSYIPTSLLLLATATTTLAADCGGHHTQIHTDADAPQLYPLVCSAAMASTNGGYGTYSQYAVNSQAQVSLWAGHANNCYAAMQQIIDQCFRNGYESGTWK